MKCRFPNCKIEAGKDKVYCIGHTKMMGKTSVEKLKTPSKTNTNRNAKPKKRANKMSRAIYVLKKIVTSFLSLPQNNACAIKSPVCVNVATCVNHKAGRIGKKLTDIKYMEPSCDPCNIYIEQNNQWAMDNGHKVSRLSKSNN